jgi:nitrogen fixation/metabolism regulation signal transduction histidine kinase
VATIADQAERIRAAEREGVSRFLVHQFRNSLTPIGLGSQNLRQVTTGSLEGTQREVADNALRMIDAQTERMKRLIDEFASLTRFPAPSTRPVELVSLLRGVLDTVPVSSPDAQIRLSAPHHLSVLADPTMLEHAVLNLIENALDALSDGSGLVEVGLSEENGAALYVHDTGKGIEEEMVARIFDEHFTTKRRGLGLGLSFVKRVCDAHGFALSIESEKGVGTTVYIDLSSGVKA